MKYFSILSILVCLQNNTKSYEQIFFSIEIFSENVNNGPRKRLIV